jgi:hypothetical protein
MSDDESELSTLSAFASIEQRLNESISISTPVSAIMTSTPSPTPTPPTDHDVRLTNGHVWKVNIQPSADDEKSKVSLVRYTSEDRVSLPTQEKLKIEAYITENIIKPKFKFLDVTGDTLSDIYGLETAINLVQQHFEEYDLLQVFQIVHPHLDSNGQPLSKLTGSTDFFSQWSNITRAEVALHTRYLKTFVIAPYAKSNLLLTAKFLISNMDAALYNKCLETYHKHPPIEHGGPLLFHIMLGHLTVSNDRVAAKHLTYLRDLKLSDFEGENVQTLVSNVRIILKRLAAFERTDPHNPSSVVNRVIPQDFGDTLIQLFQSSSVP